MCLYNLVAIVPCLRHSFKPTLLTIGLWYMSIDPISEYMDYFSQSQLLWTPDKSFSTNSSVEALRAFINGRHGLNLGNSSLYVSTPNFNRCSQLPGTVHLFCVGLYFLGGPLGLLGNTVFNSILKGKSHSLLSLRYHRDQAGSWRRKIIERDPHMVS